MTAFGGKPKPEICFNNLFADQLQGKQCSSDRRGDKLFDAIAQTLWTRRDWNLSTRPSCVSTTLVCLRSGTWWTASPRSSLPVPSRFLTRGSAASSVWWKWVACYRCFVCAAIQWLLQVNRKVNAKKVSTKIFVEHIVLTCFCPKHRFPFFRRTLFLCERWLESVLISDCISNSFTGK